MRYTEANIDKYSFQLVARMRIIDEIAKINENIALIFHLSQSCDKVMIFVII